MLKALLDVNTLSFPGLGIGEFKVNEVAFTIFGKDVAWYGIIVTLAIISVCATVYIKAPRRGIKTDDILDYFIFSIVFGIIGARLYYIVFDGLGSYVVTEGSVADRVLGTLYNCVAVWRGGIAIYGGVIAIILTVLVVSKIKKISPLKILDMAGHGALLGQAIGRWGNFVNAEAHGTQTDIFCRMGIKNIFGETVYYHPTFLYESLWNLCGFFVIMALLKAKKQKYDGQAFIWYVMWYGFGRMFIEGLRTDSLYIGSTGIRVSQLLAFCLFIGGVAVSVIMSVRMKKLSAVKASDNEEADAAIDKTISDDNKTVDESCDDTESSSVQNEKDSDK